MNYLGLLFVQITIDQNGLDKPQKNWCVKRGYELSESTIQPFLFACKQGIVDDYEAGVPCLVQTTTFPTGRDATSNGTRTTEIWAVPSKDTPRLVKAVREWCTLPNNIPFIGVWYRSLMEVLIMTSRMATDNFTDEFLDYLEGGEDA